MILHSSTGKVRQEERRTVKTMSPAGDLSTGFAIQRAAAATSVLRLYCATILAIPSAGMSYEPVLLPVLLPALPVLLVAELLPATAQTWLHWVRTSTAASKPRTGCRFRLAGRPADCLLVEAQPTSEAA